MASTASVAATFMESRRPEVVTRWAARGAESRLDSESFRADYERLDRMMAKVGTLNLGKQGEDAKVGWHLMNRL